MALLNRFKGRFQNAPELQKRIVTGVVLALIAVMVIVVGSYAFTGFVMLFSLLMLQEWQALTATRPAPWKIGGLFYILIPSLSLVMLRSLVFPQEGDTVEILYQRLSPLPVLHVLVIVIATDVGAYIVGKSFGRHKIAPSISPGKTLEGLIGGAGCAVLASALLSPLSGFPVTATGALLIGLLLAVIAQAGDLFESSVKRYAGVKDSGITLPGHGGVLDRVDGLLFAAPVYLILALLSGGRVL